VARHVRATYRAREDDPSEGVRLLRNTELSHRALGEKLGTSHETVRRIIGGGTIVAELRHAALRELGISLESWDQNPLGSNALDSSGYATDPLGFAREVLGISLWPRQSEILTAIAERPRVAIRSGHKIGKSLALAVSALWFYCSFPGARVILTAATARQIDGIIWREIRRLLARTNARIPGADAARILARSGLKNPITFSEIVGFTAREAEAAAGISAPHMLYLVDEASGVEDAIYEAIEGNRAGGAKLVLISNPTRADGEFFEAFHGKSAFYHPIHVSSEEAAALDPEIPGLATWGWIREKEREWGRESGQFKVRVLGEFPISEEGRPFPLALLGEAQKRWYGRPADFNARVYVGLDPAGDSGDGDESVFAIRRGAKLEALYAFIGLTPDDHLAHLLGMLRELNFGAPPQNLKALKPILSLDAEGQVGARVYGVLRDYCDRKKGAAEFELSRVRISERAVRNPLIYDRIRDEIFMSLKDWIRDGGALPEDRKLERELHSLELAADHRGRLKLSPKDTLRRKLGRSPDRADAVALSVWEPLSARIVESQVLATGARLTQHEIEFEPGSSAIDPYSGLDPWH